MIYYVVVTGWLKQIFRKNLSNKIWQCSIQKDAPVYNLAWNILPKIIFSFSSFDNSNLIIKNNISLRGHLGRSISNIFFYVSLIQVTSTTKVKKCRVIFGEIFFRMKSVYRMWHEIYKVFFSLVLIWNKIKFKSSYFIPVFLFVNQLLNTFSFIFRWHSGPRGIKLFN